MKKTTDGLNYREAQSRNTIKFNSFSNKEKKDLREGGYKNRGWDNVLKSWNLILNLITNANQIAVSEEPKVVNLAYKRAEKLLNEAVDNANSLDQVDFGQLRAGIDALADAAIETIMYD